MLDKYLKIFGLGNNFSLDELEGKYKKLLKEYYYNCIDKSISQFIM